MVDFEILFKKFCLKIEEFCTAENEIFLIINECKKYDINSNIMVNKLKELKKLIKSDDRWKHNKKCNLRHFGYGQRCGGNYSFYGVFQLDKGEISLDFDEINEIEGKGYDVYIQKKGYKYPEIQHFDNKINAMISAQTKISLLCCKSNYCILNNDKDFEELTNEGEENSYELIDKETDELYVKIWYKKTL